MSQHHSHLIKVVIFGDNHILRSGLRRILESQPRIVILGEMCIENGTKLDHVLARHPDVAVIDLDSQNTSVLGLIGKIRKHGSKTIILVMKDLGNDELTRQALSQGASSVILKIQPPSVLLATIESLCDIPQEKDESSSIRPVTKAFYRSSTQNDSTRGTTAKLESLTERERDIVGLIATGMKNKEIALQLHISDITVRHHLTNIFDKLGISDRQRLLLLAHQHGFAKLAQ